MRYEAESNRIIIDVRQMARLAKRGAMPTPCFDEDESYIFDAPLSRVRETVGELTKKDVELAFLENGNSFLLKGSVNIDFCDALCFAISVENTSKIKNDTRALARAVAYLCAHMYFTERSLDGGHISIFYVNSTNGETKLENEYLTYSVTEKFFNKCKASLGIYAKPEIERVKLRLPFMKSLKFPFKSMREGQDEFIRGAFRALAKGQTMFAVAPTGTGKTISALYPALRALGEERIEKVFYFTPKATVMGVAKDCILLMANGEGKIRATVITAKEKCCDFKVACRLGKDKCQYTKMNKLTEAAIKLYEKNIAVTDQADIKAVASELGVCPYELSLNYAELCDVVICDINYLFDPDVYFRRFFTEGGKYAFLIDEAHNLPDRLSEMYSSLISEDEIDEILQNVGTLSDLYEGAKRARILFREVLYPFVKDEIRVNSEEKRVGFTHTTKLPERLVEIFTSLNEDIENELYGIYKNKGSDRDERLVLIKEYGRKIKRFLGALERFDTGYELFISYEDDKIQAKVLCIDPSGMVNDRLGKGHGAVFFSATLTPLSYYKSVLGNDRSAVALEGVSPFAREQLNVSIMDKVSTRFLQRDQTILTVTKIIAASISPKQGNYIIFTPSFAYAKALYDVFKVKYPKIKSLLQTANMTQSQRREFLSSFEKEDKNYLVAFCVMGGIFAEGIDLVGEKLIGAIIVSVGLPTPTSEREAIAHYFDEKSDSGKQYAYIYPGINRVLQAAGRVIRTENDRGIIVLVDDRLGDPIYKKSLPDLWRDVNYPSDAKELNEIIQKFWKDNS